MVVKNVNDVLRK